MKRKFVLIALSFVLHSAIIYSQVNPLNNRFDTLSIDIFSQRLPDEGFTDFSNFAGLSCNPKTFWTYGNQEIEEFSINGGVISKTGASIKEGTTVSGIAFCNNLDGGTFSPTLYSANLLNPQYFDGSTWKNSSVNIPEFILNPAGSGDYLYYVFYNQLTGSKEILRYTGTEFKHIYTYPMGVIPTVADLGVDANGNVWTFTGLNDNKLHTDSLFVISASGDIIHQYPFSFNSINAYGCFILDKTIYIGLGPDNPDYPDMLVPILIDGSVPKAGTPISFIGDYSDLAACNAGTPLAITEQNKSNLINIYPNPVKDHININLSLDFADNLIMFVSNLLGNKVLEKQYNYPNATGISSIDVSNLHTGVYFLTLWWNTHRHTYKFIKE